MEPQELFYRLTVALAIGLMTGIERGWAARDEAEGERTAGLRTFTLSGLLGGVTGALAQALPGGATMLGLVFAAYAAVVAMFRYREMVHEKTFGATTVIAAYLAFALGALAVLSDPAVAAAAGVAATALLALKQALHSWVGRLTWEELRAGLVLLAMTLILLPLLPNREMGPYGAFNPHELWLMTILIAGVSAAGYVAMKWTGAGQGIALSGIAGGLVSSTAVTVSFAELAREQPERRSELIGGALLANATMLGRILVLVGSINPALLRWLLEPLLAAALATTAVAGWYFYRRETPPNGSDARLNIKNPFELGTVLKFGALLAVIMGLAKAMTVLLGAEGAFALAAVSGIADVDAITLTMSRMAVSGLSAETASIAILIAAGVNTVAKAAWGWGAGGREVGVPLAVATLIVALAAIAGFAATQLWDPFAVFAPHPVAT
jgi:uncharacterized membrane protein (DUF4010 family)